MLQLPPIARDPLRVHIRDMLADAEAARVGALLAEADASGMDATRVAADAAALIEAIRERQRYRAGINALLTEYSLSSREGVVLMCLAEALLRVPDKLTADRLIRDKIGSGDWRSHVGSSSSLFVNASAWGLLLTGKVIQLRREDSESAWRMLRQTVGRAGEPAIRAAMRLAMKIMGTQFVHGTDVFEAMEKSREWQERGYRYSYDMLGEGARDSGYALEYFEGYREAIKQVGIRAGARDPVSGPGFSVKLSALHPRMELAKGARLAHELVPRVLELARLAREHRIGLTIDAEEAHRLDLTLDLFEAVYLDRSLAGWDGFGIVVQTYLKSAPAVIDWLADLAARGARRIMVRLVKGAYWDAEIKHAQALGHTGYPVFTRKASSDLSYLVCAQRLLSRRDRLYPQFATHNAHSAAAVLALAGRDTTGFEFQRLHGMGEELYEELLERRASKVPCRIYAPVGVHRDLLAYLVRRLLENGANSSFVHNIANEELPSQVLAADPRDKLRGLRHYANRGIPLPAAIFGAARQNARGVDLQAADELMEFAAGLDAWRESAARLGCAASAPGAIAVHNPANHAELLGHYRAADTAAIDSAMRTAQAAAAPWAATPVAERAACLRRAAQRMEAALPELVGFCVKEAGKTLRDALADVREAIDFCRYYAAEAESLLADSAALAPRGPILCISPWNFPVAIFTGQVAAALVAGNPVIAKPAEQTTLVALRLVEMLHAAGVPASVLGVLCGPGEPVGSRLLGDPRLAGVMFTGSTEVARLIERALAARDGPRAMLIAETGGQNAMVVDSTALPEQVVDDVITSGFNSAGQRCSALRVLFVQHDIAERLIAMLRGAMDELRIGDPTDCATDVGPIIDNEARARLEAHLAWLDGHGRLLHRCALDDGTAAGSFFAPCLYEIESIEALPREVFGPVVHLVRYHAEDLESLPARINATGYGLTFGVHSRIQSTVDFLARELDVGNVYVNRNIIGAVVGVQPFGGHGLSGTGPKAGGPLYLPRLLRPVADAPGAAHPLDMTPAAAPDPGFDCQGALSALAEAQAEWGRTAMRERFGPARTLYEQLARDPAREALAQMTRALLGQAGGLAQSRELPGPTGESNTLVFHARGVIACLAREGSRIEDVLLPALAALLAGNAVLFLSGAGARAQVMQVRELLAGAGFADDLSAHQTCPDVAALIEVLRGGALDGAACHADTPLAAVASGALAARAGAILPLVEEPFGPCYLARFLKEKTISVNITASGGNAALMSQSESDE